MNKLRQEIDMGFTQEVLPDCHHVCLIYDNEEQRRKIVSAYLAAGIRQGNIIGYFTDTTAPEEIRAWLTEMGTEPKDDDSFKIIKAETAYCPSGTHVPQQVIDKAVARYAMAKAAGYSGSRACGEMSWALRGIPGSNRLLEYEVGLNMIENDFPRIGMCQYDARLFDGAMLLKVLKVLKVHPYMIAQGKIVQNPYYISPQEFLDEIRLRQ